MQAKLLLTGFDPFDGAPANVSWDAIAPLDGQVWQQVQLSCQKLPVLWGQTAAALLKALAEPSYQAVLCFGEGKDSGVLLEKVASNRSKDRADNQGALPGRESIVENGPAQLPSTLPLDDIYQALTQADVPVAYSESAGQYLCEECFYTLMHEAQHKDGPRGFIHLPRYPVESKTLYQDLKQGKIPKNQEKKVQAEIEDILLLHREKVENSVRVILETLVQHLK